MAQVDRTALDGCSSPSFAAFDARMARLEEHMAENRSQMTETRRDVSRALVILESIAAATSGSPGGWMGHGREDASMRRGASQRLSQVASRLSSHVSMLCLGVGEDSLFSEFSETYPLTLYSSDFNTHFPSLFLVQTSKSSPNLRDNLFTTRPSMRQESVPHMMMMMNRKPSMTPPQSRYFAAISSANKAGFPLPSLTV